MTREHAIKRITKLYGSKAYARVTDPISSPESRAAALDAVRVARAERDRIAAEIKQRLSELEWYQTLVQQKRDAYAAADRAQSMCHHYKFTVGINRGWCTEVTGQGDTWEQAISAAESKVGKS